MLDQENEKTKSKANCDNMLASGMKHYSSTITEADTWIIDSGASQHMVHNMNMMN